MNQVEVLDVHAPANIYLCECHPRPSGWYRLLTTFLDTPALEGSSQEGTAGVAIAEPLALSLLAEEKYILIFLIFLLACDSSSSSLGKTGRGCFVAVLAKDNLPLL